MSDSGYEVCSYPFTQLFLNPNGKITPCCYLAQDTWYELGHIKHQSLEEMWNSEKMRVLRRELLSGDTKICEKQIAASQCNKIRKGLKKGVELKEVMPFPMKRLDVMLNGQCNLECIMCGVWTQPNGVYNDSKFWEEGREKIFPYLKEVDAKGGEPFIQKDFYRLIDEVSSVNPKCLWHITTNGNYRFNETIRSKVEKIHIVRLSISIDSLDPENFARIRKKGDLKIVLKTLKAWVDQKRNGSGTIEKIVSNFVVQRANWHEVPLFLKFCARADIVPFFIILTNPDDLSLLTLPQEQRIQILDFFFTMMKRDRDVVYMRIIRALMESLNEGEQISALSKYSSILNERKSFGPSIAEVTE